MQTALPLLHPPSYARLDFVTSASNIHALEMVEKWPDWPAYGLIIIGDAASGKTHLAEIWRARAEAVHLTPASAIPDAGIATHCIIDDADTWQGVDAETALFHRLNACREQQKNILLTAKTPPSAWHISLPDVQSRLNSLPQVALHTPDETLLTALMAKHFADMQIQVEPAAMHYIITRSERSFAAIQTIADKLNRYALEKKRPITTALVREYGEQQT